MSVISDLPTTLLEFPYWASSWQNQQKGMCAQWRPTSAWASATSDRSLRYPHEKNIGSSADQTGQMPRLIWVLASHTYHFVGFVMRWLICLISLTLWKRKYPYLAFQCIYKAELGWGGVEENKCPLQQSFPIKAAFLSCGLSRNTLEWNLSISFQPLFLFIEVENYGKKSSLLGKPIVQVLRNAKISLKTETSSDTCMWIEWPTLEYWIDLFKTCEGFVEL